MKFLNDKHHTFLVFFHNAKFDAVILKLEQTGINHRVMFKKYADRITNVAGFDQSAALGAA